MSSFNLVQIVPSLNSGGVERGTVDVANFLAEKKIKNFLSTNIEWYPLNKISLNKDQFLEAKKFLDSLEDHDDVQKVYSNLEILD